MNSLCRKELGFTVIEIIVVLVIMGVLAATAAPKFINLSSNSPFSIDAAANMIESDIRYVQELAMATHENKTIVFPNPNDPRRSSYLLPDGTNRDLQGVTTSILTVTFNPFGEPDPPVPLGWRSLDVGGITGKVKIYNYTGKVIVQ